MSKNKCSFHSLKFVLLFYKIKSPGLTLTHLVYVYMCVCVCVCKTCDYFSCTVCLLNKAWLMESEWRTSVVILLQSTIPSHTILFNGLPALADLGLYCIIYVQRILMERKLTCSLTANRKSINLLETLMINTCTHGHQTQQNILACRTQPIVCKLN